VDSARQQAIDLLYKWRVQLMDSHLARHLILNSPLTEQVKAMTLQASANLAWPLSKLLSVLADPTAGPAFIARVQKWASTLTPNFNCGTNTRGHT
jgi:hypothetical protein